MHYGLQDDNISWKAKGILAYLLSHPNDRSISVALLTDACADGSTATRSGLRELMDAGYIHLNKERDPDGTFRGTRYIVHDEPVA